MRISDWSSDVCSSDLLDAVASPGLYLSWAPEVDLCCRLFELGLLPEEIRRRFIDTVSEYAVDGVDASVLGYDRMRAMLTKTELDALRGALRTKLLPELGAVRERRQDQYDETDDSHQHMEPYRDVAEAQQKEFSEDDEVKGVITREQSQCEQ